MTHLPGERVTPALILRELRTHNFAVLSSIDEEGRPPSAGVNYGVSGPGSEVARRRLLGFLPPATIQLTGRAEVLSALLDGPADPHGLRGLQAPR